jgi:hypothetical protein
MNSKINLLKPFAYGFCTIMLIGAYKQTYDKKKQLEEEYKYLKHSRNKILEQLYTEQVKEGVIGLNTREYSGIDPKEIWGP